jgi:Protein of unknown function (DUF1571)
MRRLLLLLPLLFLLPNRQDADPSKTAVIPFEDDPQIKLVASDEMEELAKYNPVQFMENCLRRYKRTVTAYTLTLDKQERLGGKLQPQEIIAATFREKPFSVLLRWEKGARLADSVLYVDGENQDKVDGQLRSMLVVHPSGVLGRLLKPVKREPDGKEAKQSGRYTVPEFGLEKGMLLTWNSWKKASEDPDGNKLHVEYLGVVSIEETGNRPCYKLRRTQYAHPEEDGITELTIYVDKENWLQVGSELRGEFKGETKWIGKYYFRDIRLNPDLKDNDFKPESLTK